MRSLAHWTPRYALGRGRVAYDQLLRPRDPWLTRQAIGLLDRLLRPSDVALEFGAGRSTRWLAPRVAQLTSVEHDTAWSRRVSEWLASDGLANVQLLERPLAAHEEDGEDAPYVRLIDTLPDQGLDVVLIDGRHRNHCAVASAPKLKPGGLAIIDNVNLYLPSPSRAPNSRSLSDGPADAVWQRFVDLSRDWRRVWTTNGVWDTLILVKS